MRHGSRRRLVGFAYLAPALLFVLAFTAYPLLQMAWMSLHNWSLLSPPTFVGTANYERAFDDTQFWVSFRFTLLYTALITPVLIIGGYLLALLTARNTALRRLTRTVVFIPVVIGLGVSSLLWYWLFSTDFGLVNRALLDLGIIDKPVLWLGVDAAVSNFAISASVVWKVIGFGMILFVAAIQAVPTDVVEAALVDGASPRQRVTRVILPLTLRTVLLVTLVSVIGSLLAFDQFYIMTAGQPGNETAT
ncbi:carbohydrate ABC transporter permease, partial [Nonomuraea sp. LPB2021202275-12-8]|uniref:carbohydrate ABC transporter permease n=1 Tax=Nonomuraea sp. LPB2021202275-12-8 TaxID=3120159 RepID=UPI00300C6EE9